MKRNLYFAGLLCLVLVGIIAVVFGSHSLFARRAHSDLSGFSYAKVLELDNGTGHELKLAMQMVTSPIVISYMQNPGDSELARIAFEEFRVYQESYQFHRTFWISDADKRYFSNMEFIYDLDPADPGNAWYNATLHCGETYQFYVDYDIGLKKTFMWINALVYGQGRQPLGIAGTGIELTDFVDSMYQNLPNGITMYLYNSNGEISGSLDIRHLEEKTPIVQVFPELKGAKSLAVPGSREGLGGEKTLASE